MAFTYDPATDRGRVRMLTTDRDNDNQIFQDDEIDAFLDLEGGNIRYAAAMALEAIAADQALVLKVITSMDLTTNGAAVGSMLMKLAVSYRAEEERQGSFDIAEMVVNDFSARERWWKQAQRGAL